MRSIRIAAAILAIAPGLASGQETSSWHGVAASRRPDGPVLVWNGSEARLSENGEAPFRVVAAGDPPIADGAVGDHGGWALLRQGSVLEVHARGGAVHVHDIPSAHHLRMSAGLVVLSTSDGVLVSDDRGQTFTLRPGPEPCKGCGPGFGYTVDVGITASGSIVLADTEINTCGSHDRLEWQRRLSSRGGEALVQTHIQLPRADYAAQFRVGAHGWLYGVTYQNRLFAVGGGETTPVRGVRRTQHMHHPLVADNGRITLALYDGELIQLAGARAVPLGTSPGGVFDLAVDGRGRALALTETGLLRFSRASGWEPLPID